MKLQYLIVVSIALVLLIFSGCGCGGNAPCTVQTGQAPGNTVEIVAPATAVEATDGNFATVGADGTIQACPGIKDDGKLQDCAEISVNQI